MVGTAVCTPGVPEEYIFGQKSHERRRTKGYCPAVCRHVQSCAVSTGGAEEVLVTPKTKVTARELLSHVQLLFIVKVMALS